MGDFAMAWNSNTQQLTAPFSNEDLRQALGLSAISNANVNASTYFTNRNNINIWSPNKPINSNDKQYTSMEDHNYGFSTNYIQIRGSNLIFDTARINQTGKNTSSGYALPTEIYRGEDFNGYQKNAVPPFNFEYLPAGTLTGDIEIRIDRQYPSFNPADMSLFRDQDMKYAIMYQIVDSADPAVTYTTSDPSEDSLYFNLTFSESGEYEFILCGTTRPYIEGDPAIGMPYGYFTRTVTLSGGGDPGITTSVITVTGLDSDGAYISGNYIYIDPYITSGNKTGSISSDTGLFTLIFHLYGYGGDLRSQFEIESGSATYNANTASSSHIYLNFNEGSPVNVLEYMDYDEGNDKISYVEIYPSFNGSYATGSIDPIKKGTIYK